MLKLDRPFPSGLKIRQQEKLMVLTLPGKPPYTVDATRSVMRDGAEFLVPVNQEPATLRLGVEEAMTIACHLEMAIIMIPGEDWQYGFYGNAIFVENMKPIQMTVNKRY